MTADTAANDLPACATSSQVQCDALLEPMTNLVSFVMKMWFEPLFCFLLFGDSALMFATFFCHIVCTNSSAKDSLQMFFSVGFPVHSRVEIVMMSQHISLSTARIPAGSDSGFQHNCARLEWNLEFLPEFHQNLQLRPFIQFNFLGTNLKKSGASCSLMPVMPSMK